MQEVPSGCHTGGMIRRWLIAILLTWLVPLIPAQEMLVSGAWLEERLGDPDVVVLHVGAPADFDEGHIPGARLVRPADISITDTNGLRTELPRVDALRESLGKLGVTDRSMVVVYHVGGAVQAATRVWFTLDYLGLGGRSAMLDGGLALWKKEGRAISKEAVPPAIGSFTPRPAPVKVASAEWIRTHLKDPSVTVVDARTPEYFSGDEKGAMPRAGHIPGALNVPYSSLVDADGRFKSRQELRKILRVGEHRPEPLRVTYCHVGNQASVAYFVARYLGLDVRLFDGSFQEWSQRAEFPVEQGSAESR